MDHHLKSSPETVHWGYFDSKLKPQLTIDSGDTVTITTVSGTLGYLPKPESGLTVPPELQEAAEALQTGARIIVTTRAEAPAAADALLREIERGETLYAEKVRPGEPKIMTHRGGDIL